jgi:hypothetical protein
MLLPRGFQKFAGIPTCISRIFESLMVQQISANRRNNRLIPVKYGSGYLQRARFTVHFNGYRVGYPAG